MKTFEQVLASLKDKNTQEGSLVMDFLKSECESKIDCIVLTEKVSHKDAPVTLHITLNRPAKNLKEKPK